MSSADELRHVVLDASVIVDLLAQVDARSLLAELLEHRDVELHVPGLCDVEVAAALRRAVLRRRLGIEAARGKLDRYFDLSLTRYEHEPILKRALELRENFTVYDATYVALAEMLGAPLLTADRPLAAAVRSQTTVPVIEAA